MLKLSERLLNVLDDFEKEVRSNEEILKVRLELFQLFEKKVTQLLKRDDITNDEKIKTLKKIKLKSNNDNFNYQLCKIIDAL